MTKTTKHDPGAFCWIELTTSDRRAAQQFYTSLVAWTANEMPMNGGEPYVMLQKGGLNVGALYQTAEVPPNWLSYVAVESADDSARTAKDLGANLLSQPFDVMDVGRMAVVEDPQGARFALWQAKRHHGIDVRDEPNTLCWNELMTSDIEGARKFYSALFDWKLKVSSEYTEIHVDERGIGGLMQISPDMAGMPPHWHPYFMVENCDGALNKAKSLGVKDFFGPHDIPNVGRFAVLNDPQGATFAIIQVAM